MNQGDISIGMRLILSQTNLVEVVDLWPHCVVVRLLEAPVGAPRVVAQARDLSPADGAAA